MLRISAVLLAIALLLPSAPAGAQSWLDEAKSLFDKSTGGDGAGALSNDRIADGLKEALRVAAGRAVDEVAHPGGYLDDPQVRIPLPKRLR